MKPDFRYASLKKREMAMPVSRVRRVLVVKAAKPVSLMAVN